MNFLKRWKLRSLKKKVAALYKLRKNGAADDAATRKELALHYELAAMYDKYRFSKNLPNAELYALESYRAAAAMEDAKAQYIVGRRLLERGKFWDNIKKTIYACKVHDRYARDCYEEAFAYLESAEKLGDPLAMRLHGLAYINAWGLEKNEQKGFQLVVNSIDQENAWDRATKIFEEIGLNKSEFFSAMMSMREKRGK